MPVKTEPPSASYSAFPMGFGTGELADDAAACELIKTAVRSGVRLIDTAAVYNSEAAVGQAVRELVAGGEIKREELFIQSKLSPDSHGAEKTRTCIEKSLGLTGLDYLDAYLIHWPVPRYTENTYRQLNAESWRVMEEYHRGGRLRSLGLCNFLERHLLDILNDCAVRPVIGQLEIHPSFQQKGLARFYREQGLHVQAWGSVRNANDAEIKMIADNYKRTPQQICLCWSIQKGFMPLMASSNPEHIRQNTAAPGFDLSEADMQRLDALNTDTNHRDMWAYKRQKMY